MPSGAKKRKALKKKKEQEAFGASPSNKGSNGHGNDEHGSQDEGESDGNLSSPGSQGNGESWTRDPSPSPLSGLRKDTFKEKTEVPQGQEAKGEDVTELGRGTCHKEEKNGVDKPLNSLSENLTHNNGKADSNEAGGTLEITDDFVSEVVITNSSEHAERSTDLGSVQQKADESEEKSRQEVAKEGTITGSQVPERSEEKSLVPSGPPVTRTSWLSCCGLFDVMAGSER